MPKSDLASATTSRRLMKTTQLLSHTHGQFPNGSTASEMVLPLSGSSWWQHRGPVLNRPRPCRSMPLCPTQDVVSCASIPPGWSTDSHATWPWECTLCKLHISESRYFLGRDGEMIYQPWGLTITDPTIFSQTLAHDLIRRKGVDMKTALSTSWHVTGRVMWLPADYQSNCIKQGEVNAWTEQVEHCVPSPYPSPLLWDLSDSWMVIPQGRCPFFPLTVQNTSRQKREKCLQLENWTSQPLLIYTHVGKLSHYIQLLESPYSKYASVKCTAQSTKVL